MEKQEERCPKEDINGYIKKRINEEMGKQLDIFLRQHSCKDKIVDSFIGEWYKYEIIPTSIGEAYFVKCELCGKKIDLTDYEKW
jgi:hypothetical protein